MPKKTLDERFYTKLYRNVMLSSDGGPAGFRLENNPKLGGRIKNQSTRRHNIEITIEDLKEIWNNQNGLCYWTKSKMDMNEIFIPYSPFSPSVDRINSSLGYTKDNIVICIRLMNIGRGKYDKPDFLHKLKLHLASVQI